MDPNLFFPAILGIDAWIPLWEVLRDSPQDPNFASRFTAGLTHALPVHGDSAVPQLLLVRPASITCNEASMGSVQRRQELCILVSWPDEQLPSIRVCLLPWQHGEVTAALLDISLLASAGQPVALQHIGIARLFRLAVDTSNLLGTPPVPLMLALMQDTPDAITIATDAAASFRLLVGQPTSNKEAIAALNTTIQSIPQLYHMASCVAVSNTFAAELDALWQAGNHEMEIGILQQQQQHAGMPRSPNIVLQPEHETGNAAMTSGSATVQRESVLIASDTVAAGSSSAIVRAAGTSMPAVTHNVMSPTLSGVAPLPASSILGLGTQHQEAIPTVQPAQPLPSQTISSVGAEAAFPSQGYASSSATMPPVYEHAADVTAAATMPGIPPVYTDTDEQLELQSRFWTCHNMAFIADLAAVMQCCNELKLLRSLQEQGQLLESPHEGTSPNVPIHTDISTGVANTASAAQIEPRGAASSSVTREQYNMQGRLAPEPQGSETAQSPKEKRLNPLELQLLTVSIRTLEVGSTLTGFIHNHPVPVPNLRHYLDACYKLIIDTLLSITQGRQTVENVTAPEPSMMSTASMQSPFSPGSHVMVTQEQAPARAYTASTEVQGISRTGSLMPAGSTAMQRTSRSDSLGQTGSSVVQGASCMGSRLESSVSTSLSLPPDLLQPVVFSGSGFADVANAAGNIMRQPANVKPVAQQRVSVAEEIGIPPSPVRHSSEIQPSIPTTLVSPQQTAYHEAAMQDVAVPESAGLLCLLKAVAFGFKARQMEQEYLQHIARKLHRHDLFALLLHIILLPVMMSMSNNSWMDMSQPNNSWMCKCVPMLLIFSKLVSFTSGLVPKSNTGKVARALTVRTKLQAASLLLELAVWLLQVWMPCGLLKTMYANKAEKLWLGYDAALRPFCHQAAYHQLWPLLALIPFATLPSHIARMDTTFLLHILAAAMLLGFTAVCDGLHRRAFCLSKKMSKVHNE